VKRCPVDRRQGPRLVDRVARGQPRVAIGGHAVHGLRPAT
jgi:hypothetical protein